MWNTLIVVSVSINIYINISLTNQSEIYMCVMSAVEVLMWMHRKRLKVEICFLFLF